MIPAASKTIYRVFGLTLDSPISFPELETGGDGGGAEIVVDFDDLSESWNRLTAVRKFYAVDGSGIFFHAPGTAIFRIAGGSRITVSPAAGADGNKIRLYLLGTCMGALLLQRGVLPLHGSAVVIDGKAYAFVGESGAGKSTLAAALARRGNKLLSDDVIAVKLDNTGNPIVTPSYPQQKLWDESLRGLGMDTGAYSPLYSETNKFAVPTAGRFHQEPVPLAGVFELGPPSGESLTVRLLQTLERFPLLLAHTYRNQLVPLLGLEQWHFSTCAAMFGHIGVYRASRPAEGFTAGEMADRIIRIVSGGKGTEAK